MTIKGYAVRTCEQPRELMAPGVGSARGWGMSGVSAQYITRGEGTYQKGQRRRQSLGRAGKCLHRSHHKDKAYSTKTLYRYRMCIIVNRIVTIAMPLHVVVL